MQADAHHDGGAVGGDGQRARALHLEREEREAGRVLLQRVGLADQAAGARNVCIAASVRAKGGTNTILKENSCILLERVGLADQAAGARNVCVPERESEKKRYT